jgi:predicted ArsR family transcriptional regulator
MTEDMVEEVVSDWVTETTPRERVHSVIERTYDALSAAEVAEQAETTPKTARKHLKGLSREGFVTQVSQPDRKATLYKRSPTSLVIEEAARINNSVSKQELVERIAEMKAEIKSYRDQAGADSPEDAALQDESVDEELLFRWRGTRRNMRFAKAALAISQAEDAVEQSHAG